MSTTLLSRPYLEVDHVDRVFPSADGSFYTALKNIHLKIHKGEFISLIGHSGCGKSTLLNLIAGLDQPSCGGIILEGRQVTDPGPDRMVIFQNYSLLPWLTVRENIALAVDEVLQQESVEQRAQIVEEHIRLVGLQAAADKRPAHLSGGMKQRVAIARALATRPKLLLLDEPFGALDALTRGNLQEQLMQICQASQITGVMVTHDVDEALLLSDRIVMLTNGPEAHIGQILTVPFPRPRQRLEVVNHPSYYSLRGEMIYFLNQQKQLKRRKWVAPAVVTGHGLEKVNVELGFIPLTDCAPLIVAKEKGLFAKYGLDQVTLSRETSWKGIADGILTGRLDAAQMVAGMPLALTLGWGGSLVNVVTALTLSRNGNAITLSNRLAERGVKTLADLRQFIHQTPDKVPTLGMVHVGSMHNLLLRHWLAGGGIHPDQDVSLTVIPPPQMVANLKAGNLDGYCVGEPWNSRAVLDQMGFVITTTPEILPSHIEKVLGVREEWASRYPRTHVALVKALLEACHYCDQPHHREEILELLCRPDYLNADPLYVRPGFVDPYPSLRQDSPQVLTFNQFANGRNSCPEILENLWILTQLVRWQITPFPRNWQEVLERVVRADVYGVAAHDLGLPDRAHDRGALLFGDGSSFDGQDPLAYLQSLPFSLDIRIAEVVMDPIAALPS
ncbi:MAG: nitrate ABC transporter ATP-binding protein [Cyanobacteriota bacterium]|nr:nitrate ABC transporter ATP-binding protein [Cyanobacteriota bacterium]